jgi:putative addiction module component (TIGR02574 family)
LELVGQLWDEIVKSSSPGELLTEGQREELRRRIADAKSNPDDWVAWEDAMSATLRRLSG